MYFIRIRGSTLGNARWPSQVIRCPYGTRLNLVPNIPAS
jgi:hypothetical protein